jgi:anti-sigma28 factor (negative regulator of flagellin synthesis)
MANTIDFNVSTNATTVLNQTSAAAENTAKTFTSAKAELRSLQQQLLSMDQSSDAFKKASARAAELKDNIGDLSAEINANAGNAFEGLSNNVGLFGSRLMDLDLAGAGQALKNMGQNVSRIDFKTIQKEIGGLISGFASLGKAILANPILLLAGAVALVVANFDDLVKLFPSVEKGLTGINEQERDLLALQTQRAEQAKKNYDNISATENVLKLQGKTEKEIRDLKIAALKTAIQESQIRLVTAKNQAVVQIEAAKRNRQILEGIIKFIEAPLYIILSAVDGIASLVGKTSNLAEGLVDFQAKLLIDPEEQSAALQKGFDEQEASIKEMQNNLAGFQLDQKKADADAAKAYKEQQKAASKERLDKQKQDAADKEKAQKDADDKELERRKKLNDEMMAEDDHMASVGLDDLIEREKKKADAKLLAEMQSHANLTNLKKEHTQEELQELKKAEEQKAQLRVDALKTSLSIISDLAGAFAGKSEAQQKKAFNIQKGVSVATATIDTYLAAQGAYASQMSIKTPDAPVRAAVAAGIAIAQGLARVAIISKQQFKGGGSTSGGSGGGGSVPNAGGMQAPSPANFDFVQNQPNQQPPLQAYVVSTQVSSNLEAQQLINNQARLGG